MDKTYPLITCIILAYKNYQHIYDAVESVIMQDYPKIELIISDDASENFPGKEIKEFIEKHKKNNFKKFLIRENKINVGIVKHMNIAFQKANGDYILYLSGDDKFYEVSTIRKIVDKFIETKADILSCRRCFVKQDLTPIEIIPSKELVSNYKELNTPYKQFKALSTRRYNRIFCGASLYYKRDFLVKRCGFDEKYRMVEDNVVCIQHVRSGNVVVFADDIISIYYRDGGISNGKNINPFMVIDNERTYESEIVPYIKSFNKIDRRYIEFIYKKLKEYHGKTIMKKLIFIMKNLDVCILFKCYQLKDSMFIKIKNKYK